MYGLVITLIIIAAVLLILVVLAQNPKGGGLSSQFGGSGAGQVMGVKKTSDILEKLTWGCAIAIIVLSISTNFFKSKPKAEELITTPVSTSGAGLNLPSSVSSDDAASTTSETSDDLKELINTDSAQ